MRLAALAMTRVTGPKPVSDRAKVVAFPPPVIVGVGHHHPKKPPPTWRFFRRRRRRRLTPNEPIRPAIRRDYMERWELYEWHERQGTLDLYFMMFPEP